MVTTRGLADMSGTKMTLNCRNMSRILQVPIKSQPTNGALSEKHTETQNQISVKLCSTEKYFIFDDLGDNKLLNKKSDFVNVAIRINCY